MPLLNSSFRLDERKTLFSETKLILNRSLNFQMFTSISVLLLLATMLCDVQGTERGGHCCSGGDWNSKDCFHWCIFDQTREVYDKVEDDFCVARYVPGGTKIILEPIEAPVATLKGIEFFFKPK